ncbi:MmyB-like transcription regulator ligand binding domain-containing protein OS=Streptomyces tendae OX=1932 GN=F3L20_14635 PE=4 SV=1 [Streptomyces tendae]
MGERAAVHDGSVRPLLHPDPRWGSTECRLLVETTSVLDEMRCRRVTFRPAGDAPPRRTATARDAGPPPTCSVVPAAD